MKFSGSQLVSSFVRNIQRASKRGKHHLGRGSKIGIPRNVKAKDLLARIRRDLIHGRIQRKAS
jgi:hypothetical protein